MKRAHVSDRLGFKSFYRRNLPHIQPINATLFVTFRLIGSLPLHVIARMTHERQTLEEVKLGSDDWFTITIASISTSVFHDAGKLFRSGSRRSNMAIERMYREIGCRRFTLP